MIFTALACFTTVGAAAALVGAIAAVPLQAIGAAVAAISLVLVEVSAPMSIMLAGLSPQPASDPDATRGDPMLCPHRLSAKAIRAYDWLTSLVVGFSASAALGAIGAVVGLYLAGGQSAPGIAFATITGGVLLLRARSHRELARSVPLDHQWNSRAQRCSRRRGRCLSTAHASHSRGVDAAGRRRAMPRLHQPHGGCLSVGRRSVELLEYLASGRRRAADVLDLRPLRRCTRLEPAVTTVQFRPLRWCSGSGGSRRAAAVRRTTRACGLAAADRQQPATSAGTAKPAAAHRAA